MLLALIGLGLAAGATSLLIVARVRNRALLEGRLDIPGPRSSHLAPTPRGGGIGFVAPVVALLVLAPWLGMQPAIAWPAAAALTGVAVAGWCDDRRGLPIPLRIVVHAIAGFVLAWIAHRMEADPGPVTAAVAAGWWIFWTVSAINVVNFMDGIDGLVGLQAAVYCGFIVSALSLAGDPAYGSLPPASGVDLLVWSALAIVALGAVLGFLGHNWPPASIFMGDVGSGTLGTLFALLGIASISLRRWTIVHAFLPLAPLFIDEVITMSQRISRGERLWVAHRSHVYQRLVRSGSSHARVSLVYALLSLAGATIALALPGVMAPFMLTALCYLIVTTMALILLGHRAEYREAAQR